MIAENYGNFLLALCIWREARGESIDAKIGVGCVIRNRVASAPRNGFAKGGVAAIVLQPWQFSSFNAHDPNSIRFPAQTDPSWLDSCRAAEQVIDQCPDPTGGAVFYFSPPLTQPPAAWGEVERTGQIGSLQFFKLN